MNPTVPGSDLESIPCLGNSFTKNEQSLVGDLHDARIVAQVQEIRRFVFAVSRVEKHAVCVCFCPCTRIHPRACCCVTWLCGSILSRYLLAVLSILSRYLDE